jgi:hypothetical protein
MTGGQPSWNAQLGLLLGELCVGNILDLDVKPVFFEVLDPSTAATSCRRSVDDDLRVAQIGRRGHLDGLRRASIGRCLSTASHDGQGEHCHGPVAGVHTLRTASSHGALLSISLPPMSVTVQDAEGGPLRNYPGWLG